MVHPSWDGGREEGGSGQKPMKILCWSQSLSQTHPTRHSQKSTTKIRTSAEPRLTQTNQFPDFGLSFDSGSIKHQQYGETHFRWDDELDDMVEIYLDNLQAAVENAKSSNRFIQKKFDACGASTVKLKRLLHRMKLVTKVRTVRHRSASSQGCRERPRICIWLR